MLQLNISSLKKAVVDRAFRSDRRFVLRSVKIRLFILSIGLLASFTIDAQPLWQLDSLMTSWPVEKLALEKRRPQKQRVFPAVVTEGLYAKLQKDAKGFPVFADTSVAQFADMLGEQRREELRILLGMADAYFPMIEQELEDAGLPEPLKYLPMALSAMNIRSGSMYGEAGLWMLTYPVAMRYGARVDRVIDERYDPVISTRIAVRYLKDLHAKYMDWELAAMAFACGPANITRAIAITGGAADYRALYPHFSKDHRDLMPIFMAMIHLGENARELGLRPAPIEPFEPIDTVITDRDLDLLQLSRLLRSPFKQLRYINPTFATTKIPAGSFLHVPQGYADSLARALLIEAQLKEALEVAIEQAADTIASPPAMEEIERKEKEPDHTIYTVRSGDSLYVIAKRYPGISAQTLKDYNGISDRIKPGQKIKIPNK